MDYKIARDKWNKCINNYLISNNLVRSKNDLVVYTRKIGNNMTYLIIR